jgi:hypothetical protein
VTLAIAAEIFAADNAGDRSIQRAGRRSDIRLAKAVYFQHSISFYCSLQPILGVSTAVIGIWMIEFQLLLVAESDIVRTCIM